MNKPFTLHIHSLTSDGEGIGTTEEGLKVFVEGALPNERVRVTLKEKKRNYATASLLKIDLPSRERVAPPCPYFDVCGGCQIMHLSYGSQLEYKRQRVIDAFRKIARIETDVLPCVPSPQKTAYRNKVQLPLIWEKGKQQIGFFKKGSHTIIPIETCLIQTDLGNCILHTIRNTLTLPNVRYILIKTAQNNKQALVTFVTSGKRKKELLDYANVLKGIHPEIVGIFENINQCDDNVILTSNEHLLTGKSYFTETLLNHHFRISSQSFFQVNPPQAAQLFSAAIELASIDADQVVVDAYCGVGTLAILAANYAKQVIGIEISPGAIEQAKENALLNHKNNCQFYAAAAEKKMEEIPYMDTLFINPPRKGALPSFLTRVSTLKPKNIIYISCNPETLARDISLLPNYEIITIKPFDMFPQTTHVETLVKLKIKK